MAGTGERMSPGQMRLVFLGDVTCDRPMLKAAYRDGSYHFADSLCRLRPLTGDADYVIANLETVFGGEEHGYNPYPITYNSPDSLCEGLAAAGINVVTTANNHCLDMGGEGALRTLRVLDQYGIKHTGTFAEEDKGKRYLVLEKNGVRTAIVSFTDEINDKEYGSGHSAEEWSRVNCLRPYRRYSGGSSARRIIKKMLPMTLINKARAAWKRKRGIPLVSARIDDQPLPQENMAQIGSAVRLLEQAGEECDFVIACIHCGGQFNYEPGTYSKQLYDLVEPHCDAVIGNHPHVVQRMEISGSRLRAYSLGSVNMSPGADYIHHGTDCDYSVLLSFTADCRKDHGGINEIEFKVIHAEEDESHYVRVAEAGSGEKAGDVSRRFRQSW